MSFTPAALPPLYPAYNIAQYGADRTGARDSSNAFAKAYAQALATLSSTTPGAYVAVPSGVYRAQLGSMISPDGRIGLIGAGSEITQVNLFGSGADAVYHYNSTFDQANAAGNTGLPIGGLTLDGTNVTGTAAGVHIQDITAMVLYDLLIQNFTAGSPSTAFTTGNGSGVHMTGNLGWSERLLMLKVRTRNVSMHYNFDGTGDPSGGVSFDYARLYDCYSEIKPGQVGIMAQLFAQLDQPFLGWTYNMKSVAAGATSHAFVIGPTDPSTETSRIRNATLAVRGEVDGAGSTCNDLHVGTWAEFSGNGTFINLGTTAGLINSGSVYIGGDVSSPAFPANLLLFGVPGPGAGPVLSAYAGKFATVPASKGLALIDWIGSGTLATIIGGSGNPNGGSYFSKAANDVFVRNDAAAGAPNSSLYVAQAGNSNNFLPLVQAAIATGTAVLVAGVSGSVANANVTVNTVIRLSNRLPGGTVGALSYVLTAGTGFVIHSSSGADTSTVYYEIVSY